MFLLTILGVAVQVIGGGDEWVEGNFQLPVRQELRVLIYEEFDEENEHEQYEQAQPVVVPFGAGGVVGRVTLMSGCKWRTKEPTLPTSLAFPLLPQDGDPPRNPRRDPLWDPPWEPPPFEPPPLERPPLWTPTYYDLPTMAVTLQVNSLTTNIRVGSGSSFNLSALNTQGIPIGGASGGGAVVVPGPPGGPPAPPPPSKGSSSAGKGSFLGGSDADETDDQSTPLLVGPELALPLKADVTEWEALGWLPRGSNLSLYGHALYGEMRIFDSSVGVSLYGLGPRVGVPFLREGWLLIDGLLSMGPAFLHTDIGDTAGLDFTAGLGAQLRFLGALSFTVSAEYRGFIASDVDAHGPSLNFGLNLSW